MDQAARISRLIRGLEEKHCIVSRDRNAPAHLRVSLPGWDRHLLNLPQGEALQPMLKPFWDRATLAVSEQGEVRCRMHYWSWTQVLFHGLVTGMILNTLAAANGSGISENLFFSWLKPAFLLLAANLIPLIARLISFHSWKQATLPPLAPPQAEAEDLASAAAETAAT